MPNTHQTPRILIVDDEPHNIALLVESLLDFGFTLDTANNGSEALDIAQTQAPDLVLMDIQMPVMDGLSACRAFKNHPQLSDIPIVFITVCDALQSKLEGFAVGGVDYLTKPLHPEEVIARVTIHLGYANIKHNLSQCLSAYEARYGVLPELTENSSEKLDPAVLVQKACDLLLENVQEPLSLEALTQQLNTNRERLNKCFQAVFGMSPFSWLREERLRQAADMLRYSNKPLKVIAHECGYSAPSNFNTAFKHRFDITPREFRRKYAVS